MKHSPRSSVFIDLAAVRHNVAHLLGMLAAGARLLVAVRADAYGHDGDDRISVEEIARRLATINYEITGYVALDRQERRFLNETP